MFNLQKSFGEDIGYLKSSGDMGKCNNLVVKGLSDVVTINFNVLSSLMKNRLPSI